MRVHVKFRDQDDPAAKAIPPDAESNITLPGGTAEAIAQMAEIGRLEVVLPPSQHHNELVTLFVQNDYD